MTDYLDEFNNLVYRIDHANGHIELRNLRDMNGMQVAELLTYLHDDGYRTFGSMSANRANGFLRVEA